MAKRDRQSERTEESKDERDDHLEFQGIVEDALPSTLFKVRCEHGALVLCTLAGKLRLNRIRVLAGDNVTIQTSPYDPTKGRIVWREKS